MNVSSGTGLPGLSRPTRVIPDQRPLNGRRCCVVVSKSCIQPCRGHFTAMPKRPKKCPSSSCRSSSFSSSSLSHFLFPRYFSGTITDRDIINTPLEPLRPADVPFGGFVDIAPHFRVKCPENPNFEGVNRRFQAKLEKC